MRPRVEVSSGRERLDQTGPCSHPTGGLVFGRTTYSISVLGLDLILILVPPVSFFPTLSSPESRTDDGPDPKSQFFFPTLTLRTDGPESGALSKSKNSVSFFFPH